MSEHAENAKRTLRHYLRQAASGSVGSFEDWECQNEIDGIVDAIVAAAVAEIRAELVAAARGPRVGANV